MKPETQNRGGFVRKNRRLLAGIVALALLLAYWGPILYRRARVNPERLQRIPLSLQADFTEPLAVFNGEQKSVATSGCGATCVSMALSYLTGREISPDTLFLWACDNNQYFGDGLSHETLSEMVRRNGARGEWVANEEAPVLEALAAGYPVIAHMGPGTFTEGGHYILLRGIDESGKILVNDPASAARSEKAYDMSLILGELRRENSFMILRPR